ncbi:MAG: thiamine phosphate synthase YjbQ (UPF0047 family) [Candidatus Paceibacteria bacterium]|jgi:thiamine phosphate synthase YjbQ (UPF0047 family)
MFEAKVKHLSFDTKHRLQFITITDKICDFIAESGVKNGMIVIQSHHTTASIWVNENEKNLIGPHEDLGYEHDIKRILDRFANPDEEYGHNDICDNKNPEGKRNTHLCEPDENGVINECINGHAHAQGLILQCSVTMAIENGALVKGTWQEIMLVELDHNRTREVTLMAMGTAK